MKNKQLIKWSGVLLSLTIILSGCNIEKRSETIIIPNNSDNDTKGQGSQPFQVETIYRLPNTVNLLLGWSDKKSVIGVFNEGGSHDKLLNNLQRLTTPYEKPEMLKRINNNTTNLNMSPDGKFIAQTIMSSNGVSLKLIPVGDGKDIEVVKFNYSQQIYLQDVTWSNNNRYLCYLSLSSLKGEPRAVGIYDIVSKSLRTYELNELNNEGTLIGVSISDDGKSLLFTMLQTSNYNSIILGTINSNKINIQYKHQTGGNSNTWLNNHQFVFLGKDDTLYEYDRRNGEISVLLEKVDIFEFSSDRKKIVYSLNNQNDIYVGKLQGKNILYQDPIYRGIIPSEIYWSPDSQCLLLRGTKMYSQVQNPQSQIIQPEDQGLIIVFK
ncbi:WD40 repeat domain-containing protein [Heyndrickxia sp. FSL K6-6286]|uniref:WD40 repeat domain-containing protein n=1 Tax=Heyndrickxia TaxID=2837504 RepID=UPI001C0ED4D8|nr:WD40 repeat domain-containing protein [Heyndrickxia oleronia]MBU5210842.1 WD40 repeat domain-containing protein [Heyndrickxia oleronia]